MNEVNMAILREYTKLLVREYAPGDLPTIQRIDGGELGVIRRILEIQRERLREQARSEQGQEQEFTMSKAASVQEVISALDRAGQGV